MPRKHLLLLCCLALFSCNENKLVEIPQQTQGLAPIYLPPDWQDIRTVPATTIQSPVQTFRHEGFLLVLDDQKGIHLIDNTADQTLTKTGFLSVPGCKKMALYNDHLYVNNFHDLLIFQVGANAAMMLEKRIANAFEMDLEINFPTHHIGFFECIDPARGPVVAWKDTLLISPQCWR